MENETRSPGESLRAAEEAARLNGARLVRPRGYWVLLGALLSLFALLPYAVGWPVVVQFLIPPALLIAIAVVALRRQPSAVRKLRLSGPMALQLLGFALAAAALAAAGRALFEGPGWWWAPLAAAALVLGAAVTIGPAIDRAWARRASRLPA